MLFPPLPDQRMPKLVQADRSKSDPIPDSYPNAFAGYPPPKQDPSEFHILRKQDSRAIGIERVRCHCYRKSASGKRVFRDRLCPNQSVRHSSLWPGRHLHLEHLSNQPRLGDLQLFSGCFRLDSPKTAIDRIHKRHKGHSRYSL